MKITITPLVYPVNAFHTAAIRAAKTVPTRVHVPTVTMKLIMLLDLY